MQAPAAIEPLVKKAIGGLSSIGDAFAQFQPLGKASDEQRHSDPTTLVWVHLSRDYLANYVERNVDRTKPVRDNILGTEIVGRSRTTGKTRFILHPNDRQANLEVEFVGKVHADTTGWNGPATLQYLSDSTFRAHKRITIGESGLVSSRSTADAPTRLTATSLSVSLPGLRGRIGQRIAWGRVRSSQAEADAIAGDHTARDIRHDLDAKVRESLAAMQTKLQSQLADLKLYDHPILLRSRSTPDYMEVAICRQGAAEEELSRHSFPIEGNPDLAVRVHRTVLAKVLADGGLREKIAPMLGSMIGTQLGTTSTSSAGKSPSFSMDGEWLAYHLQSSSQQASPPRVALEENMQGEWIR